MTIWLFATLPKHFWSEEATCIFLPTTFLEMSNIFYFTKNICVTQRLRTAIVKRPDYVMKYRLAQSTGILLEKLIVAQIIKYSPSFHGAGM
jgi:hypothetical protein